MKVFRSSIPPEGKAFRFTLDAARRPRLVEGIGPQSGRVDVEMELKPRLDAYDVRGRFSGQLDVPCTRCLDTQPVPVEEPLELVLAPRGQLAPAHEELQLSSSDLDVSTYEGEELDLGQLVEDELLLIADEQTVEEDEDGRCTRCGRTEAEVLGQPDETGGDHPFAALKTLLNQNDG